MILKDDRADYERLDPDGIVRLISRSPYTQERPVMNTPSVELDVHAGLLIHHADEIVNDIDFNDLDINEFVKAMAAYTTMKHAVVLLQRHIVVVERRAVNKA